MRGLLPVPPRRSILYAIARCVGAGPPAGLAPRADRDWTRCVAAGPSPQVAASPAQRDLLAAVAGNRFLVRRAVVELSRAPALWALGLLELLLDVLVGDLTGAVLFRLEWFAPVLVPHAGAIMGAKGGFL